MYCDYVSYLTFFFQDLIFALFSLIDFLVHAANSSYTQQDFLALFSKQSIAAVVFPAPELKNPSTCSKPCAWVGRDAVWR